MESFAAAGQLDLNLPPYRSPVPEYLINTPYDDGIDHFEWECDEEDEYD